MTYGDDGRPIEHRGLITVSIMLATIMQAVDTTIANVALPHIQGAMSATVDQIAWVLTSYIVASAIMTPPTGWLAARFGRKRLFIVTVAGFTLASMLCGAATSLSELVLFRVLQGAFGAGLVPLSQAVLLDSYPRERHGSAMAIWGLGVMVGPIIGPTLGGYLTDLYNWRWVFYINLPVGVLTLAGLYAFVPETVRSRGRRFDFFGFALLSLSIGALQLMLDRGQTQDWFSSAEIITEAVLAGLCLYLFLVHMMTHKQPFIEPGLFKDRNLAAGLVFIFIFGIVLLATMALLPPFLQDLMGYPVMTTGLVLAPRGIGTMIAMVIVGRLIERMDARLLVGGGLLLMALALHEMSGFTTQVSTADIVRTGIIQGLGLGLVFVPLSTITFATLAPHFRTEATAMFSLIRNLGSSIGISIVVGLLGEYTQINHAMMAAPVTPLNPLLHAPFLPPAWDLGTTRGLAAFNGEINRQAATIGYLNDFKFMMYVTLLALPLLPLMRRPPRAGTPQPVAE
ncbi:MAG TPA: DHA2 family efflux MFS transporter permease subunit [Gammaproteobacteria bacterium]|nr:DHA2 family efflux MFS transporter permease subunit [Gammaproteobacteria bacterium]